MTWGPWHGPCHHCGGSHDGWDPGSLGGHLRCLRAQAVKIVPELVDAIDQVAEFNRRRIRASLVRVGVLPDNDGNYD